MPTAACMPSFSSARTSRWLRIPPAAVIGFAATRRSLRYHSRSVPFIVPSLSRKVQRNPEQYGSSCGITSAGRTIRRCRQPRTTIRPRSVSSARITFLRPTRARAIYRENRARTLPAILSPITPEIRPPPWARRDLTVRARNRNNGKTLETGGV